MTPRSPLHEIRNWCDLARISCYQAAKLAKACRVSDRTLRRFFHDELLTSLRVWLERRRINDAKKKLQRGVIRVKQAAREAGYAHSEHFSRSFKALCGISPKEWMATRRAV